MCITVYENLMMIMKSYYHARAGMRLHVEPQSAMTLNGRSSKLQA